MRLKWLPWLRRPTRKKTFHLARPSKCYSLLSARQLSVIKRTALFKAFMFMLYYDNTSARCHGLKCKYYVLLCVQIFRPAMLLYSLPRCVLWPNGARWAYSVYRSRIRIWVRHFDWYHFRPIQRPKPEDQIVVII